MKKEDFFMKLTLEEKFENVKLHIEDEVPLYEIQRTRGQNVSSLKYFMALYKSKLTTLKSLLKRKK